jgi:hypothetical protein
MSCLKLFGEETYVEVALLLSNKTVRFEGWLPHFSNTGLWAVLTTLPIALIVSSKVTLVVLPTTVPSSVTKAKAHIADDLFIAVIELVEFTAGTPHLTAEGMYGCGRLAEKYSARSPQDVNFL